jgi:hypothetical protein
MNNKVLIIITACFLATIFSCEYEDFVVDYQYTAVYFPHPIIDRTVITGEYMDIKAGIYLGGRVENTKQEWATFELDQNILNGTSYILLPTEYYTMENSDRFIIPEGQFQGLLKITINPELFCSDTLALNSTYALGFRLLDTSVDTILEGMDTTIITFKYTNTYHGNYYHKGLSISYINGNPVDTMHYPSDDVWELKTFSIHGVTAPEMGNISGSDYYMDLTVSADNAVTIVKNPDATVDVTGSGQYDPDTRTFILEYSFLFDNKNYSARDTLLFRNRIVDGINQWDL